MKVPGMGREAADPGAVIAEPVRDHVHDFAFAQVTYHLFLRSIYRAHRVSFTSSGVLPMVRQLFG